MNEFHKRYWITKELADDLTKITTSRYDPDDPAKEINNPKPILELLGFKKPLTMEEKLERLFRGPRGLVQQMYEQGEETPEEMNDLEMNDDIEPLSPYEYQVMQEETEQFTAANNPLPPTEAPESSDVAPPQGQPEGGSPQTQPEPKAENKDGSIPQ